jgi:hypothetical protein
MQLRLFPHIYDFEQLEANTIRMVEGLKALGIPVLVTEQYVKGLGETINPIQEALGEFYKPMEKAAFSCCGDQVYMDALIKTGKKNVIILGIESHVCVLQTVIDLIPLGFTPVLVEDCVSSRKLNDKKAAIKRMRTEGAIVTTYESILFELLKVSGTNEFRAISKIVK